MHNLIAQWISKHFNDGGGRDGGVAGMGSMCRLAAGLKREPGAAKRELVMNTLRSHS